MVGGGGAMEGRRRLTCVVLVVRGWVRWRWSRSTAGISGE